ncbi:MAG: class I SAM-dependent methyltransferase [Candidatus Levybacteria bacterium]|nr:class I SAM-dependent methyltransferase [Candidatus Levybacteria bacterium]
MREADSTTNSPDIQEYLDGPGNSGYLQRIPEDLATRVNDLACLGKYLIDPIALLSVGAGNGEELQAFYQMYGSSVQQLIGIDISQRALDLAGSRLAGNPHVSLILGDAVSVPLGDESVDGIVLSSLLHEVYSYSVDGKEGWNSAVREAARLLRENGCMLIRDSQAPNLTGEIQIQLRTILAQDFYEYFIKCFRSFNGWDASGGKMPIPTRIKDFPPSDSSHAITLPIGQASELLLHFANFLMGYPSEYKVMGDKYWKELNEIYYIPTNTDPLQPMSSDEYAVEVIAQADLMLADTKFRLVCLEQVASPRPRMRTPIMEHFYLALPGSEMSPETSAGLVNNFGNKMDIVFKKVKK